MGRWYSMHGNKFGLGYRSCPEICANIRFKKRKYNLEEIFSNSWAREYYRDYKKLYYKYYKDYLSCKNKEDLDENFYGHGNSDVEFELHLAQPKDVDNFGFKYKYTVYNFPFFYNLQQFVIEDMDGNFLTSAIINARKDFYGYEDGFFDFLKNCNEKERMLNIETLLVKRQFEWFIDFLKQELKDTKDSIVICFNTSDVPEINHDESYSLKIDLNTFEIPKENNHKAFMNMSKQKAHHNSRINKGYCFYEFFM